MASVNNPLLLELAGNYLGLAEYPGAKQNPQIVDLFKDVGHGWVKDDETPWCAAFVGSILASAGLPHTGKLNARSYLDWGYEVPLRDAMPGDVVILWRNHPNSAEGHVGIVVRFNHDEVLIRGGNQGNKVTDAWFPVSRIVGIRRPMFGQTETGRPLLKAGEVGPFVEELQTRLRDLRYFSGKLDGQFGRLTRAAVVAFQTDNGLVADGVVGQLTWDMLYEADPRPERKTDAATLKAEGSQTIKSGETIQTAAIGGGVLTTLSAVASSAPQLEAAQGVLQKALLMVRENLTAVAVIAVCVVVYLAARKIIAARVEAARSGADLSK